MNNKGTKNRVWAIGLSISLLCGILAFPGCTKKKEAASNMAAKHDSLDVLSDLKAKTEQAKYHLQGDISKYDGKTQMYTSFHEEMREFVKTLSEANMEYVDDWDPDKFKFPVYEFCLESFDSTVEDFSQLSDAEKKAAHITFSACWSDGYLITASGDVLKCDIDFEKLCGSLGEFFELSKNGYHMRVYNRISALWNGEFNKKNMMTLDEFLDDSYRNDGMTVNKADGWSAEFKAFEPGNIKVAVKNDSAPGLIYGEGGYADVFKKIDGTWYHVPTDPSLEHVYFTAVGYMLHAGDSTDLELLCGELPKGEYAVLVDLGTGVTAEFEYELVEFSV